MKLGAWSPRFLNLGLREGEPLVDLSAEKN
jgi:hypothetical protein